MLRISDSSQHTEMSLASKTGVRCCVGSDYLIKISAALCPVRQQRSKICLSYEFSDLFPVPSQNWKGKSPQENVLKMQIRFTDLLKFCFKFWRHLRGLQCCSCFIPACSHSDFSELLAAKNSLLKTLSNCHGGRTKLKSGNQKLIISHCLCYAVMF